MRVILFRHGIAVDHADPSCPADAERPLTATGIDRTRLAVHGLARLGVAPTVILTSPYVRARQTAEIVAEELAVSHELVLLDELVPSADPREFPHLIAPYIGEDVLVAGHNPHLSCVVSLLAAGRTDPIVWLKKAGAAAVDLDESLTSGELVWLLPPRALRRLGGRA